MTNIYDDFNEFVAKILEEIKEKDKGHFDIWLGAASVAIGGTTTSALLPRLGFKKAIGTSLLTTPFIPAVGAAVAGGAAYLMAKYLSKAKTEQGKRITENIESAKIIYNDYLTRYNDGEIDFNRKKDLIDKLFDKVVSGKEIA